MSAINGAAPTSSSDALETEPNVQPADSEDAPVADQGLPIKL